MAKWQTVAEGTNIWDLESTIGELHLPKGSEMRVEINLTMPVGWAFDIAGAEHVFEPFIPDGMDLVDVYGEGSKGYIDMEADPARLLLVLAFIRAHWLAITIAGFILSAIIASIIVLVKIAVAPTLPVATIAIAGGLLVGGILLAKQIPRRGG